MSARSIMNIWFAANIPEGSNGGVSRSMQELSHGLQKHGHCTEIVYGGKGKVGCNYLVFALYLGLRLVVRAGNPPDWIVARSTDGVLCAAAARLLGLKTKVALHNHGWEEYVYEVEKKLPRALVSSPTSWKARAVRFPLLRASLCLCTCCLSGTLFETGLLAKRYPRHRKKMFYLPNGVHTRQEAYWIKAQEAPLHILATGGQTWKKNIGHSIEVFSIIADHFPRARLFLVGVGYGKGDADLGIHDCSNDTKNRIEVVACEKPELMARWYTECPFVISSSRFEGGHSLAVLEALSYGCVVFASALPSTREIITHERNGILMSGAGAVDDARIIIDLLKKKELIVHIRQNALRTAWRNRWDRQVGRLEAIICPKP